MAKLAKTDRKVKGAKERKVEDHVTKTAIAVEKDGIAPGKDIEWDVTGAEVHSDTNLEDDKGTGKAVVLRFFDFLAHPEAFRHQIPSKQELFSAHKIQIENALWTDDMKIFEEVAPKVMISKNKRYYRIVVAGLPWGLSRTKLPTLSEIANDHTR